MGIDKYLVPSLELDHKKKCDISSSLHRDQQWKMAKYPPEDLCSPSSSILSVTSIPTTTSTKSAWQTLMYLNRDHRADLPEPHDPRSQRDPRTSPRPKHQSRKEVLCKLRPLLV